MLEPCPITIRIIMLKTSTIYKSNYISSTVLRATIVITTLIIRDTITKTNISRTTTQHPRVSRLNRPFNISNNCIISRRNKLQINNNKYKGTLCVTVIGLTEKRLIKVRRAHVLTIWHNITIIMATISNKLLMIRIDSVVLRRFQSVMCCQHLQRQANRQVPQNMLINHQWRVLWLDQALVAAL